jgi:2-oxoglutarate ferredoxin oxidoreductase subunit delta
MAKNRGAVLIDTVKCKGCELCIEACPTDVLSMSHEVNAKGYHYAYMENADQCTGCANCGIICPDGVISVYQMKMEEIVA